MSHDILEFRVHSWRQIYRYNYML